MGSRLSEAFGEVDLGLNEVEAKTQEVARRFAQDHLRPVGRELDRLSPQEVIAEDSGLWKVFDLYHELGLDLRDVATESTPLELARLSYLINEELGWGDCGLGWSLYASGFAQAMIGQAQREDLLEEFCVNRNLISMWSITEPNHGSNMLDFTHTQSPMEEGGRISDCVAVETGDGYLIKGQKSAWGSNGSIADIAALFCRLDDGSGETKRAAFIVPLDLDGVSRSQPLDKLGVRALTDAELFFDEVFIPKRYLLAGPNEYEGLVETIILGANPGMAVFSVGLARAAFEYALTYAKERIQSGRPIFEFQAVQLKLFDMYRKWVSARTLIRSTMEQHAMYGPKLENSVACKVTGTTMAVEVTNQAFEIFAGNGISKEYPVEKLLRDARLGTIADGTNDVLSLMAVASRF